MPLKLFADESLDFRIVLKLREIGFEVISVLKDYQGISDKEVLSLARQFNVILITEDSDFGEWVFAHKEKATGIIFLRYKSEEVQNISSSLIALINKHGFELMVRFLIRRLRTK